MAETRLALIGSESLAGREIRDVLAGNSLGQNLKLIAGETEQPGKLVEHEGEPAFIAPLDPSRLEDAAVVFLAGSSASAKTALDLSPEAVFIDLTYAAEENSRARLRAPMVEPPGYVVPPGSVHVIAHPAAIAITLVLGRIHAAHPIRRAVVHVFEPASERGTEGLNELQQQTVNLLSFKPLPRKMFDEQVAFNLLARYGDEASVSLEDTELRIERHLATLLSISSRAPMPSLRLIHAPVFHGYSLSVWLEFAENPGTESLERALESDLVDVRTGDVQVPNIVSMAGQRGVAVGAVALDRNDRQACWLWIAADNLRLHAENAVDVARELA